MRQPMSKRHNSATPPVVLDIRKKMIEKNIRVRDLERKLKRSRVSISLAWKGKRKRLLGEIKRYVEAA